MADSTFNLPPLEPKEPQDLPSAQPGMTPPSATPPSTPPSSPVPPANLPSSLPIPPPSTAPAAPISPRPTPPPSNDIPIAIPGSAAGGPPPDLSALSPFKVLHKGDSTSLPIPPAAAPAASPLSPLTPPPTATPPAAAPADDSPFNERLPDEADAPIVPASQPVSLPVPPPVASPQPSAPQPAPVPEVTAPVAPSSPEIPTAAKVEEPIKEEAPVNEVTPPTDTAETSSDEPPKAPEIPSANPESAKMEAMLSSILGPEPITEEAGKEGILSEKVETAGSPSAPAVPPPVMPPVTPPAAEASAPVMPPAESPATPAAAAPSMPAHPSKVGGIAIIGLIIAIILLLGAGYVLALNGSRVPLLYTFVSGLQGNAKGAAQDSLAYLATQDSYTFANEVTMTTAQSASNQPPTLPDNPSKANLVYDLKATSEGAFYRKDQKGSVHTSSIGIDTGGALPLAVRAAKDDAPALQLYFPDSLDAKVVTVDTADLHRTLLQPIVRPVPLEALLGAVQSTKSTQKRKSAGRVVTAYAVSYDTEKLKNYLPQDAVLEGAEGTIELGWKGKGQSANQPVGALLKGTLKYKDTQYQFRTVWNIGLWGSTIDTGKFPYISQLLDDTVTATATETAIKDVAAQLGINDLSMLPNNLDQPVVTNPGSGTATAEPAAAPTGEKITTVQSTITSTPPVPQQPATEAAKARDTQRKQDITLLQTALERYKKEKGQYPAVSGIEQTISSATLMKALVPTYLTAMPVDPLPNTYWYEYESSGASFALRALLEDHSDPLAKKGGAYYFYEVRNQ